MKSKTFDRALQVLLAVLVVTFFVSIAGSFHEKVIVAGDTAPDFSIRTDSGRRITPSDFGGKVLVLNFWATWCASCVEEIPSLDQFQKRFANSGVVVVAVSSDKSEKAYRRFLDRFRVSFQTARDPEADISGDYGTFKIPETYIIDRSGKVVEKVINSKDWNDEETTKLVQSLL